MTGTRGVITAMVVLWVVTIAVGLTSIVVIAVTGATKSACSWSTVLAVGLTGILAGTVLMAGVMSLARAFIAGASQD